MAETQTAGEAAQAEVARQAVILVFGFAGVVLMIWAQRGLTDPDMLRTHRMRLAKHTERFWATLAARAWAMAERARLEYERESA